LVAGVAAINKENLRSWRIAYQIEFYSEDLDTSLFPDEASQSEIRNWYFLNIEIASQI